MAVDERHGFAAERIGEVFLFVDALLPAQYASFLSRKIRMRAAKKTEELIEPAPLRMKPLAAAQVPFAHEACCVARRFQSVGDRCLRQGQTDSALAVRALQLRLLLSIRTALRLPSSCPALAAARIEFVSEAGLIAAGEQSGPRG